MGFSWLRGQTPVSCFGRWILYHWPTREAPVLLHFMRTILESEPRSSGDCGRLRPQPTWVVTVAWTSLAAVELVRRVYRICCRLDVGHEWEGRVKDDYNIFGWSSWRMELILTASLKNIYAIYDDKIMKITLKNAVLITWEVEIILNNPGYLRVSCSPCCVVLSPSVVSDSLDPMNCSPPGSSVRGDSPGKNTGVGCHALLQVIVPTQGLNPGLLHCRQILYHLSHLGSPRILEWVAYPFSSESSLPSNRTRVSCTADGFFIIWATSEALIVHYSYKILIFPEKEFNFNSLRVEMILDTLGLYLLSKNLLELFCFCIFDSCNLSLGALPWLITNYRGCVCLNLYLLSILQGFLLDFSSFPSQ